MNKFDNNFANILSIIFPRTYIFYERYGVRRNTAILQNNQIEISIYENGKHYPDNVKAAGGGVDGGWPMHITCIDDAHLTGLFKRWN